MTEQNELFLTKDLDLEAVLEALIFVSSEPLSPERMAEVLLASEMVVGPKEIKMALSSLMSKWQEPERSVGRGLALKKIASAYVFATQETCAPLVKKVSAQKPLELSKAQVEVLSIVAYRQPITRVDVDDIRGVDSSSALKRLMQFKLLKILGKSEGLGRPLLYGTSKQFLEFFCLNSLNDLPTLKQLESLSESEQEVPLADQPVSVKDLFLGNDSMFSEELEQQSDEALKSLDAALLRMDSTEQGIE